MIKPKALLYPQDGDGPRSAMRKMRKNEISSIIVVDDSKKIMGILRIENALEALNKENDDLQDYIEDVPLVEPEATVDELFSQIAGQDIPLPVVDKEKKLMGIIIKSNVLSNLATEEVV